MSDIEFKKLESSSVISNFSVPEGYVTTWMEADSSGNPVMKAKKHGGDVVTVGGSSASGNLSSEAVEKLSVEPELKSANVGRVFQWAGASSECYRHGSIYEIRESSTAVPASASEPMKAAPAMMSLGIGEKSVNCTEVKCFGAGPFGDEWNGTYVQTPRTNDQGYPIYETASERTLEWVQVETSLMMLKFSKPGVTNYSNTVPLVSPDKCMTQAVFDGITKVDGDTDCSFKCSGDGGEPGGDVTPPADTRELDTFVMISEPRIQCDVSTPTMPFGRRDDTIEGMHRYSCGITDLKQRNMGGTWQLYVFYDDSDVAAYKTLPKQLTKLTTADMEGTWELSNGQTSQVTLSNQTYVASGGGEPGGGSGGGSSVSFPESFRITSPESFAGNYTKTGEPGTSYNGNTYPVYNGERRGSNISPRHFRCVVNSNGKYEFTAIEGNITCRSSNSVSDSKPFGANDLTGSYSGSGSTYYLMAEGNTVAPSISITSSNPLAITAETDKSSQVTVTWRCDNCAPGSNYVRFTKTEDSGNVATLDNDHPLESSVGQTTITIMASSEGNHTAKFDVELRDSEASRIMSVTYEIQVHAINSVQPPIEAVMINPGREESVVSVNRIGLKIWTGTQGELDAVSPRDKNTLYIVME